jgi:hypothetical protein
VGRLTGLSSLSLISRGIYFSNRMFVSADGRRYEWRRSYPEDPTAYDVQLYRPDVVAADLTDYILKALSDTPHTHCQISAGIRANTRSAIWFMVYECFDLSLIDFRREVGPSYAYLQFCFDSDRLLLEALLALCVNRWMDKHIQ